MQLGNGLLNKLYTVSQTWEANLAQSVPEHWCSKGMCTESTSIHSFHTHTHTHIPPIPLTRIVKSANDMAVLGLIDESAYRRQFKNWQYDVTVTT